MTSPAPRFGVTSILSIASAVLLPLGIALILLGWHGASHTPYLFEQVPYLISGGLLGLGLAAVGGLLYFGSWVARGNEEQRRQNEEIAELLREIRDGMQQSRPAPAARTASNGSTRRTSGLVATAKGAMIHRPDCAVVAGRDDLRAVSASDSLNPCALCSPLEADVPVA